MLAKKTLKNQLTLPKKIADRFPGTGYFDVQVEDGAIVLRPIELDRIDRVRDKLVKLGITQRDVSRAVEWARASER